MRPHFLIIGKNGQVGWELGRVLGPLGRVSSIDFPQIDLTQPDSIRAWVRDTRPRVILNAAAYTAVDKAEADPERANQINGAAPGILAEEARKAGALLVHYSTDYVFDGAKREPYVETDVPNPLNQYGRSKLAGDTAIGAAGGAHLIFRLCWVYGNRGQNFMRTIMRLARERETLRVVNDQVGCPTWSRMIAQATAFAVQSILAASDPASFSGLYHLASAGTVSWHGFAQAIVSAMPEAERKAKVIEPIPASQYPTPARRPAFSALGCDKLERAFGLRLPRWDESLRDVLDLG
jgi:dTDP-4-dehydrorhamnose reductase